MGKGLPAKATKAQRANGYGDDALRVYNSGGVGALKGWNGTEATLSLIHIYNLFIFQSTFL